MGLLLSLAALLMVQADVQTEPADAETAPVEEPTAPADPQPAPADPQTAPADPQTAPTNAQAPPADLQTAPAYPQTAPADLRTVPASPQTALADPRIRVVPYNPDQIVTLGVAPGFAAVVELADDERVDNVVVGNSALWQVTANRSGDRVIVKPLPGAVPTNMIVVTGSRRYVFMLEPGDAYYGQAAFVMRFSYPQPPETAAAAAPLATYRFRGSKALFPRAMYYDGRRTIISWDKQTDLPAIFAMGDGRQEQLVNGRMVGDDFVIEGTASRYKFRYGRAEATAIRQSPERRQ